MTELQKTKLEMATHLRELITVCQKNVDQLTQMPANEFNPELVKHAILLAIEGNIASFHAILVLLEEQGVDAKPNGA